MRIICIPGLGEDELVFSKILPLLPGNKVVLDTWTLIGNDKRGSFSGMQYAREVVQQLAITNKDIIIGHSLGGLTAWYIKALVGCRIVQISSYTERDRIIFPISNHYFIQSAVWTHAFFNQLIQWLVLRLQYHGKPSEPFVKYVFKRLKNGNEVNVINQLKVALCPLKLEGVAPDLRIHSVGDLIVRPPKQHYVQVPGDHFNVYTYPNEIAAIINIFLQKHATQNG